MTALAVVGIALFGVALAVVAVGMVRDTVRNVRELRRVARLSGGTHRTLIWRGKSDELVFPRESAEESDLPPRPSKTESNVPPGWGFD